jgi:hypothetical protein
MTNKSFTRQYQNIESIIDLLKDQNMAMIVKNHFFENSLPYPGENDYKINKVCEHCGSKYKDKDAKIKLRTARDEYRGESTRLYHLFKESLFVAFKLEHNEKTEKAFSIAWSQGHANGFYEVLTYFEVLVPLVED